MMLLAGKPLVQRVIERVKLANKVDGIVLAVPDGHENSPLRELALNLGVKVVSGSENDLLARYYKAAFEVQCEYVVRIPADNPVPEASEIDRIIQHHLGLGRRGFSSNLAEVFNSGYPDGIGAEIFDTSYLEELVHATKSREFREHVHLNFFNYSTQQAKNPDWCPISTIACPEEFARPDLILDVNTEKQYLFMSDLYHSLHPHNPNFGIRDIINWYDNVYITQEKAREK